jgi:3-oxoacyl-[acyl-carrier protein] reductase
MDLKLRGKRAVITGASKGIGRAVAELFAEQGCSLALASRSAAELESLVGHLTQQNADLDARIYPVDLALPEDQDKLSAACPDADILVNNAGAVPGGSIERTTDEVWRKAWDLKVFGYINLTRQVYARMAERGRGVIINIIGVAGERPQAGYIIGSTSNAALMAFTRALGSVSPDVGVRVVGVNPGMTATDRAINLMRSWSEERLGSAERWREIERDMNLPFGRMATPREVAELTAFLASERAAYISGTIVTIDGGAANRNL